MNQSTIIDALQKALAQGNGTLDDLSNLLARAQEDIEKAKQEQEEAKQKAEEKRGLEIAELATRLLEGKPTDADMALVMNTYFRANDMPEIWTAENMRDLVLQCTKRATKVQSEVDEALNKLDEVLKGLFGGLQEKKKKNDKVEKDPDDIIADFLKKFGLD